MQRFTACAACAMLAVCAGSASAALYELKVTGTIFPFAGLPAASVECVVLYDTKTVPDTQVFANVTRATYAIESYSLKFDGMTLSPLVTPKIEIDNVVPGVFGDPDLFRVSASLNELFAGLTIVGVSSYAFDYGLGAIDSIDLPTDVSYFAQFSIGLTTQIGFTDGTSNFVTNVADQVVTIRLIPTPASAGVWAVCCLAGARRRR